MPRVRPVLALSGLAAAIAATLILATPAAAVDWVEPLWVYPTTNATSAAVTADDGGPLADDEPRRGRTVIIEYELSTSELRAGTAALVLALPAGVTVDSTRTTVEIENISVSIGCSIGEGPFSPASSPASTTQVMVGCTIPQDEPAADPPAVLRVAVAFGAAATRETVIYALTSSAPTFAGLPLVLHGGSLGGEEGEQPPSPIPSPELAATGASPSLPVLAGGILLLLAGGTLFAHRRFAALSKLTEK
ncbi:LPXTG cell wall anchor domain-containing protein [Antiquaquibacter soli]|uniref:LPXTG cell wall anchor domain-containing protein n=1 Tax=Antiquaquibacter soli TaxID=3064523 RepID=A0ABT9BIK0_9MICO|nr:LPXTG cell wall anchor domain-containing protein [Protaetiibacter sp. WY-16]MDO7880843.1 LPXTG cell wall anchor domain-containing protein [Protaetiibacter sp. WY-16]